MSDGLMDGSRHRWRALTAMVAAVVALGLMSLAHGQAASLASFTQAQGLGSLEDNCLLQDRRGFVYTCTEYGLFRFDGHEFQRIGASNGLRGSFIDALHQDGSGRLWVGTRTGLYVGDGERFALAAGQPHPLQIDPGATLADLDGRLYAVSEHRLWVIEPDGAGWRMQPRFDDAAWRVTPALADINSVFAEGHTLWFGCGKSLCQLTGDHLQVWGEGQGIPPDTWTSYLLARDGTLWARSPLHIRTLAPGSNTFANHDLSGARVVTAYLDMVEDDQGRLLTRANNGLARWDGRSWSIFDASNGLPDIGIDALLYDRDHVLWIGTYGRGVLQWRGYDQIQSWQIAQGLDSSPTWSLARASDGTLWLGDELGGSVLAPGATRLARWPLKAPPLAQETIALHALPNGDMLATYYSGELLRYRVSDGGTEELAHSPAYVPAAFFDSQGREWFCTERGLYVYDGHTFQRAGEGVVPDSVFKDAKEDTQGRIWFTGDAGLFLFDHGRWTHIRVTGTPSDVGFKHLDVLSSGDFYLSGDFDGLWHGRVTDGKSLSLQHVDNDLLDNSRIYFIRHDRRGWLWIGGTDGVEFFNGQRWRRLTEDDGLIWDDVAEYAFFEDADGSVWIGTSNGISHILDPASLVASESLRVVISELILGGVPQVSSSSYRFDFAPAKALTVHLATVGAPTRSNLQFRYRLRGLEQQWVNSDRTQIDYPPLPPGDFVFEVAAYDPDSGQLSPVVQLPLTIVPPWWRRTPAIVGGCLLLVLGIALTWLLRTRHLHARARKLEQLVAQRTHELEVDKRALEETRVALWHQANHDTLTGLPNRARIFEILAKAVVDAQACGQPLALALIDLDLFKDINDHHGHLAGDAVLIEVASHLRKALPAEATLGRCGGEEFLAVLPGTMPDDPVPFEAFRQAIAGNPISVEGATLHITCSIGVTWLNPGDRIGVDLVRRADAALYRAKTGGRNRVVMGESSPVSPADRL
ncbi:ligand-binding sensor domain-containing diguanylate cyclase [Dyella caseinilytica]|uniref:ligand-binding sensor domain-containing diguanylate cyclase n=1 Tax=Dyella caseinilytica TaxID=1849581 RepID=UPI001E550764|nr:ligand-binding sensor domain-containing diguanylate cyclase [Dyella caseinilytica]